MKKYLRSNNVPREPTIDELKRLAEKRPATIYKLARREGGKLICGCTARLRPPPPMCFEVGKVTETTYDKGIYCHFTFLSASKKLDKVGDSGTSYDYVILECFPLDNFVWDDVRQNQVSTGVRSWSVYVVKIVSELKANIPKYREEPDANGIRYLTAEESEILANRLTAVYKRVRVVGDKYVSFLPFANLELTYEVGKVTEAIGKGVFCHYGKDKAIADCRNWDTTGNRYAVLEVLPIGDEISTFNMGTEVTFRAVYVLKEVWRLPKLKTIHIHRHHILPQSNNSDEIKVGDVVRPIDGSSMPNGYHMALFNGKESPQWFEPVKVVAIEGNLLGVSLIGGKEYHPHDIWEACSSLWTGSGGYPLSIDTTSECHAGEGFWIHRAHVKKEK